MNQKISYDSTWRNVGKMNIEGVDCQVYQRLVPDGHLTVLVSNDSAGGWHLSISHSGGDLYPSPVRYPSWDEITDARYQLIPDEVAMVMHLPPREEYVNFHPTTFHLWELPR